MTEATPDAVRVVDRDGVRWIELDRPGSRNGLTIDVNRALIAAITGAGDARVLVLTGAGGSFCSGLDLKEAMRAGPRPPADLEADLRNHFHGLVRALRQAPQPTIAAVDGPAAGFGCDLALSCDLRVMSDRARFGEIFVRRGLIPDGGGTWLLPRLIGAGRAFELLYTGDQVDAETALRIGLGNRLWPAAELVERTWELARGMAKGPPRALRLIKQAVWAGLEGSLDEALDREAAGQLQCLQSRDFVEGMQAFLSKREPSFTGE
jgi:2-(1,2-epoxy-1,2-dihydrophenyl)acetyl-CoA isomerase